MVKHTDVAYEGSDWQVDLAKLVGTPIKTVVGHISMEMGGPCFVLGHIEFEDGTCLAVEGEHDFPYLVEYRQNSPVNLTEEVLQTLYDDLHPEEEE